MNRNGRYSMITRISEKPLSPGSWVTFTRCCSSRFCKSLLSVLKIGITVCRLLPSFSLPVITVGRLGLAEIEATLSFFTCCTNSVYDICWSPQVRRGLRDWYTTIRTTATISHSNAFLAMSFMGGFTMRVPFARVLRKNPYIPVRTSHEQPLKKQWPSAISGAPAGRQRIYLARAGARGLGFAQCHAVEPRAQAAQVFVEPCALEQFHQKRSSGFQPVAREIQRQFGEVHRARLVGIAYTADIGRHVRQHKVEPGAVQPHLQGFQNRVFTEVALDEFHPANALHRQDVQRDDATIVAEPLAQQL